MPKAPVGISSSSRSCFCQAYQCVGMIATSPTWLYCCVNMSWVCQCCIVIMHGCCLMLQGSGTQQCFQAMRAFWECHVCSNHLWLFILIFLPASCCMNGELHNEMMGYCQICMIGIFIHMVGFCNSKVKAGSSNRVHLQRLSSQPHDLHSSVLQRGILLHRQTKTSIAASFSLAASVFGISRKCQAYITAVNLLPIS